MGAETTKGLAGKAAHPSSLRWLRGPATQNATRPRRRTGLTCVKPRSSEEPVRHPNGFDGFDPVSFAESCGIPPPRQGYHLVHPSRPAPASNACHLHARPRITTVMTAAWWRRAEEVGLSTSMCGYSF